MKKIMLVDDIVISNFIVKKLITKFFTEYEIYDYTYSLKALDDIIEINPDIIFLDLNMPEVDGWRFLDLMIEKNINHPVYILSSSTSELDLRKSKLYGNVKEFLVKPLNISALKTILTSIA